MAKKKKTGIVYSTNPDFQFSFDDDFENETLPPGQQHLKVSTDKKHRGGKIVTLIRGFIGNNDDLKTLGKLLKTKCGVGGSVKDSEIIIQGDHVEKISAILRNLKYKVKPFN